MKIDPTQPLLYDSRFEHDACGVGFVANISGRADHSILSTALEALTNLTHRGAVDADGKTGDGAGILTQLPGRLFLREVETLGYSCGNPRELAVGVVFLGTHDNMAASRCRKLIEETVLSNGLFFFGWRRPPLDYSALGAKAAATLPIIEHFLVGSGRVAADQFERVLYLVRKEIERAASEEPALSELYIPSLSGRTIVYKGLMVAGQLKSFYADLRNPDFDTALALIHQRYSTNTFPNWSLAQPFRMLAHNGEINTLTGNRNWMRARESDLRTMGWGEKEAVLKPVIWAEGSDSASLDNVLELLTHGGRDLLHSMMILVPDAYENRAGADPSLRGFYDYASCVIEPWDGPAAVAFSDGRFVGAALDRNGLRPARYAVTADGLIIMASEAGAVELAPDRVIEKGRLGPGKLIAVDTEKGVLLSDEEIKAERAARKRYAEWVRRSLVVCPTDIDIGLIGYLEDSELVPLMKSFGYTLEDVTKILEPMLTEGKEPIGSMGDDTPLAVLSEKPRQLYGYFKQRFAQVTNPAIDPIRERTVMSLATLLGPRGSLLEETPEHAALIRLQSPIVTNQRLQWIRDRRHPRFEPATLEMLFDAVHGPGELGPALYDLCGRAVKAIEEGTGIIILSDRGVCRSRAPIPALLAVAAVHHHLIRAGMRMRVSLVVETGDAREDHHCACLIGYGANGVNPYLAFEVVAAEVSRRGMSVAGALRNYKTALETGLLKIMAKMGIATVASYCGAQTFEAIGLDAELIENHFSGTPSRLNGAGLEEIAADVLTFHHSAFEADPQLEDAGYFRYRAGGEFHSFNPAVFRALHKAVRTGDTKDYDRFREQIENRPPASLRDLLDFRAGTAIPVDEVEPAKDIVIRMSTSGMSHGALSREAHQTLAIAMNRLGAKTNSGEGGEDPSRYYPRPDGDWANSRIKQVASARFGVTPEYLVSADEIEIKISQGSKPGEGGQLPGHKVTAEIAAIRHSVPGVTLISPPPHHDIYSIEDIAQLIYDLKQVNPRARVAVKLVSEVGVGTVAAGVAKAHADVVHISGHDGGTGASPLGSIKNAGTSWEFGLAEAQQVLVLNDLRGRVRLRVDGGLKSGRDIVMAAMLGADEFGFATSALVALGCVMARQCHLNTCPVGIASQEPHLREKFAGKPEMVVTYFISLAEEVRRILANLGFDSLGQVIGRSDLLIEKDGVRLPKTANLDLKPVLNRPAQADSAPRHFTGERERPWERSLGDELLRDAREAIHSARRAGLSYTIRNVHRSVGAKVAGEIARHYGNKGLPEGTIDVTFRGSAGQSFGAFAISGMRLTLIGEANDYVGKGMSGGEIVIRPPHESCFDWSRNTIIGNTAMYGATGGTLYAAGRAGERFCVRNSGGCAVVEGVGDHGCEYMTAGIVIVLGKSGRNFAAGMTGGVAYVLDLNDRFRRTCNQEMVELERVTESIDLRAVRYLTERHYELTGSLRAREVLWHWDNYRQLFWKVVTQGARVSKWQPGAVERPEFTYASAPVELEIGYEPVGRARSRAR